MEHLLCAHLGWDLTHHALETSHTTPLRCRHLPPCAGGASEASGGV